MPNWVFQRVNDVGAVEGRARANVIDFNDPCEPGMPNFNEHADDDDDSTYHDDYSCYVTLETTFSSYLVQIKGATRVVIMSTSLILIAILLTTLASVLMLCPMKITILMA